MRIENVKSVTFDPRRWALNISIENGDGTITKYVASADSAVADSGIFFGTQEEYDEALDGLCW